MDPSDYFHSWYGKGKPQNYAKWANPAFQDLVSQIDRERDAVTHQALITQAEAIFEQDPPLFPIAWEKIKDGWYTYVEGHISYHYFGMSDVVRFDTAWLDT